MRNNTGCRTSFSMGLTDGMIINIPMSHSALLCLLSLFSATS